MSDALQRSGTAPIVLFAYNRPAHTLRCLQSLADGALAANTELIAYVDGPKAEAGRPLQQAVVAAIETLRARFARVTIHVRPANVGLAANVIDGITRTLVDHDAVIVMEDDLQCGRHTLEYFNEALRRYAEDSRVGSIHAYCYPGLPPEPAFFFMPGGDCWGWATWRDRWALFEPDGRQLLRELIRRRRLWDFTLGFCAPYLRMLCRQILGRNNSWAVRWHASLFLAGRLTLYPSTSFVQNTGLDGTGTHCDTTDAFEGGVSLLAVDENTPLPAPLASAEAARYFQRFFCANRALPGRILNRCASGLLDLGWMLRVLITR